MEQINLCKSSPRELCPSGRTAEIDAILDVINKAKAFINIAVMDYAPITFFQTPMRSALSF